MENSNNNNYEEKNTQYKLSELNEKLSIIEKNLSLIECRVSTKFLNVFCIISQFIIRIKKVF